MTQLPEDSHDDKKIAEEKSADSAAQRQPTEDKKETSKGAPKTPEGHEEQPSPEEIKARSEEAGKLLRSVEDHLSHVIGGVPKKALSDNLKAVDKRSYAKLFKGFRPHKIPRERLVGFVRKEAFDNANDMLAHVVILLWNESHMGIYNLCKERLEEKYPNVEEIEKVDEAHSKDVLQNLVDKFGLLDTALFCKLNEVRFEIEVLKGLLPDWDWSEHPQKKPE